VRREVIMIAARASTRSPVMLSVLAKTYAVAIVSNVMGWM
jgi:hypothetical protein